MIIPSVKGYLRSPLNSENMVLCRPSEYQVVIVTQLGVELFCELGVGVVRGPFGNHFCLERHQGPTRGVDC